MHPLGIRTMGRITALAALLVVASCSAAQPSMAPCSGYFGELNASVKDVIRAACLTPPTNSVVALDREITSYAVLNDADDYILGYYMASTDGSLGPPIHLLRYHKASQVWSHEEIEKTTSQAAGSDYDPCFGSLLSITRIGTFFYLETHINPSATCTLVFSSDLKLRDNLFGWLVASFPSGAVVLEESMVHFAPTHPMKLALYDPEHLTTTSIYPPRRDELRAAYIRRLKNEIPANLRCVGDKCADPDPADFESFLAVMPADASKLAIAVSDKTHALALVAEYSPQGFISFGSQDQQQWSEQVVYVYRLSSGISHREFHLSEMQKRYGANRLDDLLKPGIIRRLFAASR